MPVLYYTAATEIDTEFRMATPPSHYYRCHDKMYLSSALGFIVISCITAGGDDPDHPRPEGGGLWQLLLHGEEPAGGDGRFHHAHR